MKFNLIRSRSKCNCLVLILLGIPIFLPAQTQIRHLWGTTAAGGENGLGTIYRVNPDGTGLAVQKSFQFTTSVKDANPFFIGLTLASNGKLYGTTSAGNRGMGGLFEFDPSTLSYTSVFSFNGVDGQNPGMAMTQASNGKLYGTTTAGGTNFTGVIFEFDLVTKTQTVRHNFPAGTVSTGTKLTELNGKLYGTMGGQNGYIFEFDPSNHSVVTKYTFNASSNAQNSRRGVMAGPDGKLYGLATGGSTGVGTLFQLDPVTSAYVIKKTFNIASGGTPTGLLVDGGNGKLYGTTQELGANGFGTIFEFDPVTDAFATKFDFGGTSNGSSSVCTLNLASNGKLYGLSRSGGATGSGTLFEFDPTTGTLVKKVDLPSSPTSSFISTIGSGEGAMNQVSNGKLYGMLALGNAANSGYIFEYDPISGIFTNRFDFGSAANGANPPGELTLGPNNKFYGVTQGGGLTNQGVIYEYDPASQAFSSKANFSGSANGAAPIGRMIIASNGKMYGTTSLGGTAGRGTLFEFDYTSGLLTKKVDFNSTTGSLMNSGLTEAPNGKLYGVNRASGAFGGGTLFEFNSATGGFIKLLDFNPSTTGLNSQGQPNLVVAPNGKLYGTTAFGGANLSSPGSGGTIYEIDPTTSTYTKKVDMGNVLAEFAAPKSGLVLADDGKLYGIAYFGGANGNGGIYEYVPGSTTVTKRYDFPIGISAAQVNASTGNYIQGSAMRKSPNGKLYGTLNVTGISNQGILFEFDPANGFFTTKFDFDIVNGANPNWGALTLGPLVTLPQQTINFNVTNKVFGSGPFDLDATTNSNLPITYSSTSDKVTISANHVTILKPGSATITASQSGNYNFSPATSSQTFCINPAKPTITVSGTGPFTLTASSTNGNQWFLNGNAIDGATNATLTASKSGSYKVRSTADDCISEFSAEQVVVITGDISDGTMMEGIAIFPNPASSHLIVLLPMTLGKKIISFYQSDGRQSDVVETFEHQISLPVSDYPQGLYLVKVTTDKSFYTARFVKD